MSGKLLLAFNFSLLVATALSATTESISVPQPTQPPAAGSSRPTTTVNASTTQAPATPVCDGLEAEPCCNTTGCGFYSCISIENATLNHTGCHVVGKETSICAVNISENTCPPSATDAPTTLAPPTTVKTENPVTSAEPVDPCEGLSNQAECCSSPACSYIKCIDLKDQPHEGCHKNTTVFSEICKANQTDLCSAGTTAKPTTTLQPAPTTAEGITEGGSTKADNNASTTVSSGNQNAQSGDKKGVQTFDAPSFVGGMVLVAGVVGIIFFGLKFYKARTERNYHTL